VIAGFLFDGIDLQGARVTVDPGIVAAADVDPVAAVAQVILTHGALLVAELALHRVVFQLEVIRRFVQPFRDRNWCARRQIYWALRASARR
jgi:hypothetical protein